MEERINTTGTEARARLALFTGGTGGIDNWLTGDHAETVVARLNELPVEPISCSQLNQLLALSHQAEVSEGFFRYYWLSEPRHPRSEERRVGKECRSRW